MLPNDCNEPWLNCPKSAQAGAVWISKNGEARSPLDPVKPHPDSEVEFWPVGNLTACGTSPSQGCRLYTS